MKKRKAKRNDATNTADIEERITPVREVEKHLSAVLYGRSGTGKTTFACDFPKPLLLLDVNDRGTDSVSDVKGVSVLHCDHWSDIEKAYWYLRKNKKFKTVVIDTVSMMQDLAIEQVIEDKGGTTNGRMMTKQDWGQAAALLKTWIMNYRDLNNKMEVVFIAQDRIHNGEDDEGVDEGQILPEVGPRIMPSVASTLNAAVSFIGNTFVRESVKKIRTKDKKIKEKRKIEYCLRIGPHAYYTTKTRKPKTNGVPSHIVDPSYEELVDTLTLEE